MRLIKIHLKNFCQHRDREILFDPGLNLILGPNGAGKSNLIESIQFALTGDLQKHTREQAICQEADKAEPSWVSLDFQHLDYTLHVTRGIRPVSHLLTCSMGGSEKYEAEIEGYNDVNKYILDLLDLQKKQLEDYVFIAQGAVDSLISKTKEQRTLELAKIFNVADTERIWETLGTRIAQIEVPSVPNIEDLEAAHHATIVELSTINDQLDNLRIINTEREIQCRQQFQDRRDYERHLIEYYKLRDELDKIDEQLATELPVLEIDRQNYQNLQLDSITAEDAAKAAQATLRQWAAYEQWQQQRQALEYQQQELSQLILNRPKVYKNYNFQLNRAAQEYDAVTAALNTCLNNIVTAEESIESAVCKTCKRPFDNYTQINEALEQHKKASEFLIKDKAVLEKAINVNTQRMAVRTAISLYRKELLKIREIYMPQESKIKCEGLIGDAVALKADCTLLAEFINKQKTKIARLLGRKDSICIEEKLQQLLQFTVLNRRAINIVEQLLSNNEKHKETKTQLMGLKAQREFEATHLRESVQQAFQIRDTHKKCLAGKDYLLQLREIFHRSKLPKLLIETHIDVLAESVNDFLTLFDAPFKVTRGEHLGFDAIFTGRSKTIPDKLLSGGQKVMLSLAFRVALNSQFTASLGLLSLDEPTAHLDQQSRACLPALLERLRELCRMKSMQILFITHDADLTNISDNIIQLGV